MKIIKDEPATLKRGHRVTVELEPGETLINVREGRYYRLGGQMDTVALLIAIFKARPSPFYVMDEVEAALDDTNLGRLLGVFEELREKSQLIVITHQKRTMEIADALYGVTMRGDGVSEVISQRIREVDAVS
jgi:ABC-type transport system involved in cytochrome bd biosynthesis fused ATPase/permease subunit